MNDKTQHFLWVTSCTPVWETIAIEKKNSLNRVVIQYVAL